MSADSEAQDIDCTPLGHLKTAIGSIYAVEVLARFIGAVYLEFASVYSAHAVGFTSQRQIPRSASSMICELDANFSRVIGF